MLSIRPKQMEALSKVMLRQFEERMVVHLKQFFAEECDALGSEGPLAAIRQSLERAAGYGMVAERDVCMYTDVMFAFGRDFDKNQKFPWAARILHDAALQNKPSEKAERLYHVAMNNAAQAQGITPETER